MIVVDVETSGVDPSHDGLLSIGAVDFADPKREFYMECRLRDGAHVHPEALAVNGFTETQIHDPAKITEADMVTAFIAWVGETKGDQTFAGQNVAFDRDFLKNAATHAHIEWRFAQRVIDLHSVAYAGLLQAGRAIPINKNHSALSLDVILGYLGLPPEEKPHVGIRGARLEAECFSRLIHGKGLYPEFEGKGVLSLAADK